ncbi:hypothetical protein [Pedobacter sp. MW01-1-1]|uniref:hypothetical protein n=1 Tax=Pedobacter sp. MW01-1-1 TaxID=3383027 RepID=UPI003FED77F1
MQKTSPYEFYNNNYGVKLSFLVSDVDKRHPESVCLFSYGAYEKRALRIDGFKLRSGGGAGNDVLVNFAKLKPVEQKSLVDKFGDPVKTTKLHQFVDYVISDQAAFEFFSTYKVQGERRLPAEVVIEYIANAEVLNACHTIITNNAAKRKAMGGTRVNIWEKLAECIVNLDQKVYKHTLPANPRRLQEKYRKFKKDSYVSLIHKGFCNDNSRKVTVDIERLILSLYIQSNNPYVADVVNDYWRFVAGDVDIIDYKTGEIYNREHFYENGQPIVLSPATFWNYINQPANRAVVDKFRMDTLTYESTHGPHVNRHHAKYSFSKISMDDRDLPRKMPNGNRVKAYYAYDTTSGCIIGASYSQVKTTDLFIDCLRNMFRFLEKGNFGTPMQVEVEHHLVNAFKDDMMKAGVLFPFVRWANPGNSQEKWAETGNRVKKYGYEKRYQDGIGRWYAKLEANKTKSVKVFDEKNDTYKEKTYPFEVLVADDKEMVQKYNNDLHPNQNKYKDMTRAQVLEMYANPDMAKIDKPLLTKFIGDSTATTIRRNQYVQVQYAKYGLPTADVLAQLAPNNYEVTAYYLRNDLNEIESVYLYQDGTFICEAKKIETFNTANAEWNDNDTDAYTNQMKYISHFRSNVSNGKAELAKVTVVENTNYYTDVPVETVSQNAIQPNKDFDFDALLEQEDYIQLNAINSL